MNLVKDKKMYEKLYLIEKYPKLLPINIEIYKDEQKDPFVFSI